MTVHEALSVKLLVVERVQVAMRRFLANKALNFAGEICPLALR